MASSMSAPPAKANGIVVGELAYGSNMHLTFISGNVHVYVRSNIISVVDIVAQELNAQIIAALEEVGA